MELPSPSSASGRRRAGSTCTSGSSTSCLPDSGAAFVLVQHLAPHHESILSELLSKHTRMAVAQIEDGVEVAPDHVYLIPPNKTLTLAGGRLHLAEASETLRVPIDGFLTSLAEDRGACAIGIIFSGAGNDGAQGIAAIHEHGGMTMVQAPESARFDSMPRSAIATEVVDDVLRVEEMPARLMEHLRSLAARPDAPDIVQIACDILHQRTGHDFSRYKESTLRRRIARRVTASRADTAAAYLDRLREDAGEVDALVNDLLINVTRFFRDPEVFAELEHEIVPRLFAGKGVCDTVRVWVPGCASGEEAYSIAILLSEHIASLDAAPEVKIFATDIDEQALDDARRGRYPEAIAAAVSPERLARFFTAGEGGYQVKKSLRDMCVFAKHNLVNTPPFSRLDLISCRNTLIYLRDRSPGRAVRDPALRAAPRRVPAPRLGRERRGPRGALPGDLRAASDLPAAGDGDPSGDQLPARRGAPRRDRRRTSSRRRRRRAPPGPSSGSCSRSTSPPRRSSTSGARSSTSPARPARTSRSLSARPPSTSSSSRGPSCGSICAGPSSRRSRRARRPRAPAW